jgi:hypothetical protein
MNILFKYATRERRDWFIKTLGEYYDKLSQDASFRFLVTMDYDDVQMNRSSVKDFLDSIPNLDYHYGPHKTKIEAINAGMEFTEFDWDILVVVSDDMVPVVDDFDKILVELMWRYYPDTNGGLFFHDGCCGRDRTCTLSIMGKNLYKYYGYIYHPDYKSFYCDGEYTEATQALGRLHYDPRVIIKHFWTGGPKSNDALYRRNSKLGREDEAVYKLRRSRGFPKESVL